jgi:hypothetical protein
VAVNKLDLVGYPRDESVIGHLRAAGFLTPPAQP